LLPDITRELDETKGHYALDTGHGLAELTYSIASPKMIIADHTDVPEAAKGRGFGAMLAQRMVEDARTEGVKIIPLCPFVKAERGRHPDRSDVIT